MEYSLQQRAELIIAACMEKNGTNPYELFHAIAQEDNVRIHGPEHHVLDGACILTAFRNAGGNIDLQTALQKLMVEGLRMPGAACGLWGACGAVTSIGAALAIIDRTGPLSTEDWGSHMKYTSAALAYEGIQYRYMAPGVFDTNQFTYIREHLRILSGFYGLLRPFDGVTPYRLEMQARLSVDGHRDLYDFWGAKLAGQLAAETDFVLNLASKEYSRAVEPHLPSAVHFLTCTFGELKDGKVMEKGTVCKMARGQMVRWLAENNVTDPEDIKNFADLDYRFFPARSSKNNYVFIRK